MPKARKRIFRAFSDATRKLMRTLGLTIWFTAICGAAVTLPEKASAQKLTSASMNEAPTAKTQLYTLL